MASNNIRSLLSQHLLMINLFSLLFISLLHNALATTSYSNQTYGAYITKACNSTTYPRECYKSLLPYAFKIKANPQKLRKVSLSVTLNAVHNASSMVSKLLKQNGLTHIEAATIKDCIVNIKDSIDELKQSLGEMNLLSGLDKEFHIANIKTWLSAALTDENTCMDGFEGEVIGIIVKQKITNIVLKIARLTSNSLSLINSLN
ncbi:pectinesterase inhibitor 4-like [Quercus robur]|uniref:pectinesterase inhibitor 4-like n=1 Tax=Quercus robur TaxID=38942 RepID=UPI0021625AFB|nr:pectinesterase inhibitor 4-like [Quercus robur]